MAFLRENTSLRLVDEGRWFCAIHRETGACSPVAVETIAFRADINALPTPSASADGSGDGAAHFCGHDSYCAALAGLGLLLEGKKLGRNIMLIFQHAEETVEGGKICAAALEKYGAERAYALHNNWPPLHTELYTFNDSVFPAALTLLYALAEHG
jgi:metal-dependent amidase/aminoacylase/carboxypeptidase family protein